MDNDIHLRRLALENRQPSGERDSVICVLDGTCPHEGGPLGKGDIENGHVTCPWHGLEFDPCSGKDAYNPSRGVESFSVEEREDGVYVGI